MAITYAHLPSFQLMGNLAFTGAASRARRENLSHTLDRNMRYNLAQQGMALQREGMFRQSLERALDRQFTLERDENASEADLARLQTIDELSRGRSLFDYDLNQRAADAEALRRAESQKQAKLDALQQLEESARLRREQFDYEQDQDDARFDAARKAVIQDDRFTEDDRLDALLQIEAERANIQNFKLPQRKQPTLRHQLFGDDPEGLQTGTVIEHERGTFWQGPDGKVEFRPIDPPEPPITFKDYASAYDSIAATLSEEKDATGTVIGVKPADPKAVKARMDELLQGYQQLLGAAPQPLPASATTPNPPALPESGGQQAAMPIHQPQPVPLVPAKANRQRPGAMREWLASQGLVDDTGMSDRDWAVLPSDAAQQAVNGIVARKYRQQPNPVLPANANLPRPKNKAEFDKLPSGSTFIAPDGSVRKKP